MNVCPSVNLPCARSGRLLRGALVAGLAAASPGLAAAADISRAVGPDKTVTIALTGQIVEGDAQKFADALKAGPADRPVRLVTLNSPGGLVGEAYKIAKEVRGQGIATRAPARAICTSSCFLIFAAGKQKFAEPGARIGVHSAKDRTGVETEKSASTTMAMARVLKTYGVPEQIVGKMVLAAPSGIAWLSPEELRSMGVESTVGAAQSSPTAGVPVPTTQQMLPNRITTQIITPSTPNPATMPHPVTTAVISPVTLPGRAAPPPYEWMIELGAFPDEAAARERLRKAREAAPGPLGTAEPFAERLLEGPHDLFRARFARLDKEAAEAACRDLTRNDIACTAVIARDRVVEAGSLQVGRYMVLLASRSSETEARQHFRLIQAVLQTRYTGVWNRPTATRTAELGDGVVYRAAVGPFVSIQRAIQFCRELQFQCSVEKE